MTFSQGPLGTPQNSGSADQRKANKKRKNPISKEDAHVGGSTKKKKERDPNWNRMEILALVQVKQEEFMEELQTDDPRELMNIDITKWERVSLLVNIGSGISYYRSPEACKYKWQTLLPNYKRVADLYKETRVNSMTYFEMSFGKRRQKELPKNFDPYVYDEMHTWLRHKPTMNPPHFRDLLHPSNGNFRPPSRNMEDFTSGGEESQGEAVLHAYLSATAYDTATDSKSVCDPVPEEHDGSAGVNNTVLAFPSPPSHTSSIAHIR